jgi:hypothetical protein
MNVTYPNKFAASLLNLTIVTVVHAALRKPSLKASITSFVHGGKDEKDLLKIAADQLKDKFDNLSQKFKLDTESSLHSATQNAINNELKKYN